MANRTATASAPSSTAVPPASPLSEADIQLQLDRRRPGQSALATPRSEADQVRILSGVEHGLTLGTPDRPAGGEQQPAPRRLRRDERRFPRPSHADYTYQMKYGLRSASGGGRASARETIGRVAAGAIAGTLSAAQRTASRSSPG